MGGHVTIPIFVPHSGCPFDCIYCNQKNISGQQKEPSLNEVEDIIQKHLASIQPGADVEIGFFGGSFTGIERSYQLSLLEIAGKYVGNGLVNSIRLSTRPDYIDQDIIDYLIQYGVETIELGVQSLDDGVLKKNCRGHLSADVYEASRLIKKNGISLVLQTMVGLLGDDRRKALQTAEKVVAIGPSAVRIYPTLVIKDTYLEVLYRNGRYVPLKLEEAADICSGLLVIYRKAGITVIRLGLQATSNITEGGDVIAGPFHPAFGQIVESRLILKKIEEILKEVNYKGKDKLTIVTSRRNLSNVIGQKKYNINYLKNKYGFTDIEVKPGNISGNGIEIRIPYSENYG